MKLIDIVRQGALEKMSNSKIRHFIELSKLSDAKLLYCLSFQETTAAEAQSPLEPKSQSSHNQPMYSANRPFFFVTFSILWIHRDRHMYTHVKHGGKPVLGAIFLRKMKE